ncbi:MAG: MutS-related protein [Vulcanimicrobiaceae bacterium]
MAPSVETFHSILFQRTPDRVPDEHLTAPDFFVDLNLDQIVAAVTAGKDEYKLEPFFFVPLRHADAIAWRHEVMRDLESANLFDSINDFAQSMRTMREHLARADKLHYRLQKERWFLDAAETYCDAALRLAHDLSLTELGSRGLLAFSEYLTRYVTSERFIALLEETKRLASDLSAIQYTILIKDIRVQIRHYGGELDYSAEVEATFEKFKQGSVKDHAFNFNDAPEMNHVEVQIASLVAQLHSETFAALKSYCAANRDYPDETIVTFDREIQFYVAYLEHMAAFKEAGLSFCYPRIARSCNEVYDYQGFDLALAGKLIGESAVVCNDFHLKEQERIIVVSGPNQGGKTTFARSFGQLHYLASLGCPVPGTRAQLFLFDELFTHFEREEVLGNHRGRLQDDLVRVHHILERATPNSIVILNEIFTSTTLRDAITLSRRIATKIIALDLLCVWVTFVDELTSLGERTVSMVSTVAPENPALRTYKIIRRQADGLCHAMSIAEKYRLTYPMIKDRVGS